MAIFCGILLALALGQGAEAEAEAEEVPGAPLYLEGVDLSLPSQEAFRDWPPRELTERHYWLPWGTAAVQRAGLFDRPIFFLLDVGWSRSAASMLEGPLSDPRVIQAINTAFIAVRVDADLRPDVRERYQTGTWPVIAFLLPNGMPMLSSANEQGQDLPITAGPVDADTLLFLLREGAKYWELESEALFTRGEAWAATEGPARPLFGVVEPGASDKLASWMQANADRKDGGFGAAPKFVLPALVEYAFVRSQRGVPDVREHALFSLRRLLESPLYDRGGGGAHRIATAPGFGGLEPEKMLVANAALVRELVVAQRLDGAPAWREALAGTARFITGSLAREGGGFYLAQSESGVDRLVLTGANASAGAALLRAAAALGNEGMEKSGRAALDLVLEQAIQADGSVRHALAPTPTTRIYLETLADTAFALLDAYEATGDRRLLDAARAAADHALGHLRDEDTPALLDHIADVTPIGLLGRPRKPLRPNVRLARALVRLEHLGLGSDYRDAALGILGSFCGDLSGFRTHGIEAALAIEEAVVPPLRIRVSGPAGDAATRALRMAALQSPVAWTLVDTVEAPAPAFAEVLAATGASTYRDAVALRRALDAAAAGEREAAR